MAGSNTESSSTGGFDFNMGLTVILGLSRGVDTDFSEAQFSIVMVEGSFGR